MHMKVNQNVKTVAVAAVVAMLVASVPSVAEQAAKPGAQIVKVMKGKRGPRGLTGPTGPAGPAGAQGPIGPPSITKVTNAYSQPITLCAAGNGCAAQVIVAHCPAGLWAISGGYSTISTEVRITAEMRNTTFFEIHAANIGDSAATVTASAVCVDFATAVAVWS